MLVKCKFTYFKPSGKWYTDGEGAVDVKQYYDLGEAIRKLREDRKLPGITRGDEFFIVVEPLEPDEWKIPLLITPASVW